MFRRATILVAVWVVSLSASSQCNVTMTIDYTSGDQYVRKTLSAAASCMTTAMNAMGCYPGSANSNVSMLLARAASATAAPYCNWSCTCGTGLPPHVTIDSTDGLPVELIDFAVEGGGDWSADP